MRKIKEELSETQKAEFEAHRTSPFCWLERPSSGIYAIGGRDKLALGAQQTFPENESIVTFASKEPSYTEVFVDRTPGTSN